MERYVQLVQQYDNKASDANRQFERSLDASERLRSRERMMNLTKAASTLLKESNDGKVSLPRTLAVRNWWQVFVHERYPTEFCLEYLKCSRKTYIYLIRALRPYVRTRSADLCQKEPADMLKAISLEKQVAVTLHKLVQSDDYSVVTGMFGIHKSTVQKIVYNIIKSISKHLLPKLVKMPGREEAKMRANQFEDISKIPQLIGYLEATHIPISSSRTEFINKKNYPSIVLQTVTDASGCFRDVSVRHPGSAEDRRIFEDSNIYRLHDRMIPVERREINGLEIPYRIAASGTYPLLPWLLTEFEPVETKAQWTFNYHLMMVSCGSSAALLRLHARFAIVSRQIDVNYKIAPQTIAACCAIHNVCQRNRDPLFEQWIPQFHQRYKSFPKPERTRDARTPDPEDIRLRDVAKDYLEKRLLMRD